MSAMLNEMEEKNKDAKLSAESAGGAYYQAYQTDKTMP